MPSSFEPEFNKDSSYFKLHVAKIIRTEGWTVGSANSNQSSYDLIIKKASLFGVVQVKFLNSKVTASQLLKFADFLDSDEGRKFNFGIFLTTKGFARTALALIKAWDKDTKIRCGVVHENKFVGIDGNDITIIDPTSAGNGVIKPIPEKVYFGVFTCKGGVGKTTVAGHLAGAFALQGFNVALVDLDPEENLQKLVGEGVFVPNHQGVGTSIQVFDGKQWHEDSAPDCQIVICDCSPALERNPKDLIEKFNYCIIPTTLNPLGINKHGKVIQNTVEEIRKINKDAHLFVLVNNFKKPTTNQLRILKNVYFNTYQNISENDDKFHCIDPEEVCIRSSDQLYYWGIHILENPENPGSRLAFDLIGGRCYPREDFINLADYIGTKAGIGILKEN